MDVNDNPPVFTQNEWIIEIEETVGSSIPEKPILTVSVSDNDANNSFTYIVVKSSGFGADKFTMVTNVNGTGSLLVAKPLDYEDPNQAGGFKFQIQVSDYNGKKSDSVYTATSWVIVKLIDINDNAPQFLQPNTEVQVFENIPVGRKITNIMARDVDMKGRSRVSYLIHTETDKLGIFHIDSSGIVSIRRTLDREVSSIYVIRVLAVDDGIPAKTATATLTVVVMDINDNAPEIADNCNPVVLTENSPPQKFADISASDKDDPLMKNGPPFYFNLDPLATEEIHTSFKVEYIQKGDNGSGLARISSLREFDREFQKEYFVPIVIRDSGGSPLVGTSTLTVVIGDVNDNRMEAGFKEVLFYSYKGRSHLTHIGRVYVHDPDDWDLGDKKFIWGTHPHPNFILDEDSGMITMRYATSDAAYHLNFHVHDYKHAQFHVKSSVNVTVRHVSELALENAGSVRFENITEKDFIRKWDYRTEQPILSKADLFIEIVAKIIGVKVSSVNIFSIQLVQQIPPLTDVLFFVYDSYYFQSTKLNGLLTKHKKQVEFYIGLSIVMVGIDACLEENVPCSGSCTSELTIFDAHQLIDINRTSYVGVNVHVVPNCACSSRHLFSKDSCYPNPCFNHGQCIESTSGVRCQCLDGFDGPHCQLLTRTFIGDGFIWLHPLQLCEISHLSVQFMTQELYGIILYTGPLMVGKSSSALTDFIALEIDNGRLKLLINFGTETLLLDVMSPETLNDGRWHIADVYWNKKIVSIDVDRCREVNVKGNKNTSIDISQCHRESNIPFYKELLKVKNPLQIGGMEQSLTLPHHLRSQITLKGIPFTGCIRNLMMNGYYYDMATPALQKNSIAGCLPFQKACQSNVTLASCGRNGICSGSISDPFCECKSGWMGPLCSKPTVPTYFDSESYIRYSFSFKLNPFHTNMQLRFRTLEQNGEFVLHARQALAKLWHFGN
ncbi:Cadherin [Halocaridina rubra]|uniref:Cadherin n=1 Tax=Halocaridina rubra TaxID=373956 RepID=A0AAN8WHY8_HALRR